MIHIRKILYLTLQLVFIIHYVSVADGAAAVMQVKLVNGGTHCPFEGRELAVGSKETNDECVQYSCDRDGSSKTDGFVHVYSCGVMSIQGLPPGCYLTDITPGLEYPSCCPQVKCDN